MIDICVNIENSAMDIKRRTRGRGRKINNRSSNV